MSKPHSKKYSKKEDMYTVTINDIGALDSSTFTPVGDVVVGPIGVTQADLAVIQDELKAHREIMSDRLDAIEDQIVLVRRDNALEEDYKELKEAWKAYNKLAERLRTFKRLKDSA